MNFFAILRGRHPVRLLAVALPFLAMLGTSPSLRAENFLTVSDVPVDVTAKNAAAARDQAIASAQAKAFDRLVKRMVPDPAAQAHLHPSQQEIESFVQDFAVESERVSTVRYIAMFSVRFRAGLVQKYLSDAGVSATGDQQEALVVPIYKAAGGDLLWETDNIWRAAWARGGFGDGPVTLILPNADSFDTGTLSAAAAEGGDMGAIAALAQRYHAAGLVVVIAQPRDPSHGPASGLSLTVAVYDQVGPKGTQTLTVDPVAGEQADKTLLRGVAAAAAALENGWRQIVSGGGSVGLRQAAVQAPAGQGTATQYPITVQLAGIADWVKLRNQLSETAGVQRVALDALTRDGAAVTLDFVGDVLALQAALSNTGYVVVQTAPGVAGDPGAFQLRLAGSTAPAPPPRFLAR